MWGEKKSWEPRKVQVTSAVFTMGPLNSSSVSHFLSVPNLDVCDAWMYVCECICVPFS